MVSIRRTAFWAAAALLPVLALVSAKTVDITVSKKTTVEIPETLIGYMWEVRPSLAVIGICTGSCLSLHHLAGHQP